jgi:hypothetical protein
MEQAMLASVTVARARAMPMIRITSPITPFAGAHRAPRDVGVDGPAALDAKVGCRATNQGAVRWN